MKAFSRLAALVLGAIALLNACEKEPEPFLSLDDAEKLVFPAEGGEITWNLVSNQDWSVTLSDTWCKMMPTSGTASNNPTPITFICEPNPDTAERTCTLTVRAGSLQESLTLRQAGKKERPVPEETAVLDLSLSSELEVHSWFQTWVCDVVSNVPYEISFDVDWISQGFYGTDTKNEPAEETVYFDIEENTSDQPRQGNIFFRQKDGEFQRSIKVKQMPYEYMDLEHGYEDVDVTAVGGPLDLILKTNVDFEVTVTDSWLHVLDTQAKGDTYTVTVEIDPNGTLDGRRGGVSFAIKGTDYERHFMSTWIGIVQPTGQVAVDMGVSVKWASSNVGAAKPEDLGGIYAWGETAQKEHSKYSWDGYKWWTIHEYDVEHDGYTTHYEDPYITKYYNGDSRYGNVDNNTTLDPEDDVATVVMGHNELRDWNWRMPTFEECQELFDNCWMRYHKELNGSYGVILVSKINGNELFFPSGGIIDLLWDWEATDVGLHSPESYGFYWSSTLLGSTEDPRCELAGSFSTNWGSGFCTADERITGRNVRAVTK